MIPVSAPQSSSTYRVGAERERSRLKLRLREKTVMIAWMRQYLREEREPRAAPRHVRRAIAEFEAEVEAMNARLCDLDPDVGAMEDQAGHAYARAVERIGQIST